MITKRIIPCLDVQDGRVVKGINFTDLKDIHDPVNLAAYYNQQGADELVFYDITASAQGRKLFTDVLKRTAAEIFIPLTVGGGINQVQDFERVLQCGADKVSVNSGAVNNPLLIKEAAKRYGSQCVVLSVDVKRVGDDYHVYTHGGRQDTGIDAFEWLLMAEAYGAGEVVINSMDADGVKHGFDLPLLQRVTETVSLPIIASGGAGGMEDFLELFALPGIDAGLAASIFHYREVEIEQLKQYLARYDLPIRIAETKGRRGDGYQI
ncbi:imidazole glycerol phosphate synthase subunit HisF [Enterococcus sp. DIV0876]|uniref:imidazole glycerol phosphate synthase subunit HisF n=1 Tax=Enterococcus sp. DIV0876 TaxID=2774633 RepID=UPI003D2F9D5C